MENVVNIPERRAQPNLAVQQVSSNLSREFKNVLNDIETLFKATTSLSGEELVQAKAKLNARIADAKKTFTDTSSSVVYRAKETVAYTDKYVHEHPWKAVGVGTATGFLVGLLFVLRK